MFWSMKFLALGSGLLVTPVPAPYETVAALTESYAMLRDA